MVDHLELLKRCKEGDEGARHVLFHKYRKCSVEGFRMFIGTHRQFVTYRDELISEADLALFKSIPGYNPDRYDDIRKHYILTVYRLLQCYVRSHYHPGGIYYWKRNKKLGEQAVKLTPIDPNVAWKYLTVEPVDHAEVLEPIERVASLLKLCRERERQTLTMRYGLDGTVPMTHEQIGSVLGIGGTGAYYVHKKVIERLAASCKRPAAV